jgi:hypothetical protein
VIISLSSCTSPHHLHPHPRTQEITNADLDKLPFQQVIALGTNFLSDPEQPVTAASVKDAAASFR